MKETVINQSHIYELPGLDVTLTITNNPFGIDLDGLFLMAVRNNPKRRFLFVSKVLGKHIPVVPYVSMTTGVLLANLYASICYGINDTKSNLLASIIKGENCSKEVFEELIENKIKLPEKNIFFAFAETATALGHTIFSVFSSESYFIHSTREDIISIEPLLNFDEEHSHAVEHRVFPERFSSFLSDCPIVIIDDEITTGKSTLNLIKEIQNNYPRKKYIILSILDWRDSDSINMFKEYEKSLGVTIEAISLLKGIVRFDFKGVVIPESFVNDVCNKDIYCESYGETNGILNDLSNKAFERKVECLKVHLDNFAKINSGKDLFLKGTGRFGLESFEMNLLDNRIRECGTMLLQMRKSSKTLCLGYTEFMYIPMVIAHYMGEGIYYHSITQSPIFPYTKEGYGIQNAYKFTDFYYEGRDEDTSINNFGDFKVNISNSSIDRYLYNIPINQYEEVFIFMERDIPHTQIDKIKSIFKNTSIKDIFIVIF